MEQWNDLRGRTVLVTGGASGIGFGIAQAACERGGRVILADIEDERLCAAVEALSDRFPDTECGSVLVDVSHRDSVAAAATEVHGRWGALDVLVNNAGVVHNSTRIVDAPDEMIDWVFAVNVHGTINCTRAFVHEMAGSGRGGRILNASSIGGFQVRANPLWSQTLYAATKYAVVALSEGLALELYDDAIAVSVLAPGGVATDIGTSDRNRPARFGGPTEGSQDVSVNEMLRKGMPPIQVGRRAIDGVLRGEPFIFVTRPEDLDLLVTRHRLIEDALKAGGRRIAEQAAES